MWLIHIGSALLIINSPAWLPVYTLSHQFSHNAFPVTSLTNLQINTHHQEIWIQYHLAGQLTIKYFNVGLITIYGFVWIM